MGSIMESVFVLHCLSWLWHQYLLDFVKLIRDQLRITLTWLENVQVVAIQFR